MPTDSKQAEIALEGLLVDLAALRDEYARPGNFLIHGSQVAARIDLLVTKTGKEYNAALERSANANR
jgi:hypothetical protein